MKSFPIGDGQKRIHCPDSYLATTEGGDVTLIWTPAHEHLPVRASVMTVTHKDPGVGDQGVQFVASEAQERSSTPRLEGDKIVATYREALEAPNTFLHTAHVGMGNHICIFSISFETTQENSTSLAQIRADLNGMIQTLEERQRGATWTCELLESQRNRIAEVKAALYGAREGDDAWRQLQSHLDRAYLEADEPLAQDVGLGFGELIRSDLPGLAWCVVIDDEGTDLALRLEGSSILLFPESMILKRFDRGESLDLIDFSQDTIEMLEEAYRDEQSTR